MCASLVRACAHLLKSLPRTARHNGVVVPSLDCAGAGRAKMISAADGVEVPVVTVGHDVVDPYHSDGAEGLVAPVNILVPDPDPVADVRVGPVHIGRSSLVHLRLLRCLMMTPMAVAPPPIAVPPAAIHGAQRVGL